MSERDPALDQLDALVGEWDTEATHPLIDGVVHGRSVGQLKRCYKCGESKPIHEFAFRNRKTGERQGYCRLCQAAYRRDHYQRDRETYIARSRAQVSQKREEQVRALHEYLSAHPCVDCGECDIRLLEFDHVDGAQKKMDISVMLGRRNWRTILEEITKCDVRCANCHRRRTALQFGWRARMNERAAEYIDRLQWTRLVAGVA